MGHGSSFISLLKKDENRRLLLSNTFVWYHTHVFKTCVTFLWRSASSPSGEINAAQAEICCCSLEYDVCLKRRQFPTNTRPRPSHSPNHSLVEKNGIGVTGDQQLHHGKFLGGFTANMICCDHRNPSILSNAPTSSFKDHFKRKNKKTYPMICKLQK